MRAHLAVTLLPDKRQIIDTWVVYVDTPQTTSTGSHRREQKSNDKIRTFAAGYWSNGIYVQKIYGIRV